jgi:non-canonical poly(A) RNA polymerase PAPD5/7
MGNAEPRSKSTGVVTTYPVRIKKPKTDRNSNWKPTKVEASVARNRRNQVDARQASIDEQEKLLSTAKEAFKDAQDYEGVVVKPMSNPAPIKESGLPWCVAMDGTAIQGVER